MFAAVALFVGAFIIFNTFSILVAQRTRELALMRALGASKGQVTRSVLLEAVVVGGDRVGHRARRRRRRGDRAAGAVRRVRRRAAVGESGDRAAHGDRAFAVGILITAVAALLPARRAAKVPPVAAMRDAATADRPLVKQTIAGAVLRGRRRGAR